MEISNEIKTISFLSEMLRKLNENESQEEFIEILDKTASKINNLYPHWVKFSEEEPKKGEHVDIYSIARGREADYEYEGNGIFYENNYDNTREVKFSETETNYNITHYLRVPDCL